MPPRGFIRRGTQHALSPSSKRLLELELDELELELLELDELELEELELELDELEELDSLELLMDIGSVQHSA
jgi:hypothetical protein